MRHTSPHSRTLWFANGVATLFFVILVLDIFGAILYVPFLGAPESQTIRPGGLLHKDSDASFEGYTLVNPLRGPSVYLLNWDGEVVRTWTVPGLPTFEDVERDPSLSVGGVLQSKLLPNGNLLLGYTTKRVAETKIDSGSMGILVEFDVNGDIVWRYENEETHNDFDRLPDGRTAVIVWEELTPELIRRIQGGIPRSGIVDGVERMVSDAIIEVDRNGRELWRWSLAAYLDPADPQNMLDRSSSRRTWTHLDSLRYLEQNPLTGTPAYLISINKLDTVALVERSTGNILWRWGTNVLAGQHSAVAAEDGTIWAFDNGVRREHSRESHGLVPGRSLFPYSRLIAVDPRTSQIRFTFSPGQLDQGRASFYTPLNGSVQPLSNGNVLVSAGATGRIFEIDPRANTVVWDFIQPIGLRILGWPSMIQNGLYSAYRYTPEYASSSL